MGSETSLSLRAKLVKSGFLVRQGSVLGFIASKEAEEVGKKRDWIGGMHGDGDVPES